MYIHIIWVGKIKEAYLETGIQQYLKMLSSFVKVSITEIPADSKKNLSKEECKSIEAKKISHAFKKDYPYYILDETGKEYSSVSFSKEIYKNTNGKIGFVIGGVYGLDTSIQKKGKLLSFSQCTFTHQIIRLILLEQLYRAVTIETGKEYHY